MGLMSLLAVFLGETLPYYVSNVTINYFASIIFTILGLKMIYEGYSLPTETETKSILYFFTLSVVIVGENNQIKYDSISVDDSKSTALNEDIDMTMKNNLKVFFQGFVLILLSELGDKSQISTIYLSSTEKPLHVFLASIIAQYSLSLIAVYFGNFISDKISEKNLTIFAGVMFLIFAMYTLAFASVPSNKKIEKPIDADSLIKLANLTKNYNIENELHQNIGISNPKQIKINSTSNQVDKHIDEILNNVNIQSKAKENEKLQTMKSINSKGRDIKP
jgi:putative Ca2+/H+ antiporter (TMEM165/GDT1 family)